MKPWTLLCLLTFLGGCSADPPDRTFKSPTAVQEGIAVYFSPNGGAMAAILGEIDQAHRSIDVQAYLITARQIVDALKAAQDRGVRVRIVLDKKNIGGVYSFDAFLAHSGLAVWRDGAHKDSHDKIMLVDGRTIITGSFNFTDQSETQNAENLLILRDKPVLFAAYQAHFDEHLGHSDPPGK